MNVSSKVGKRIREYRNQAGLSQEKLAHMANINFNFLGDVERGKKKPSIDTLEKLLTALNVSFEEFFNFEAKVKPYRESSALDRLNIDLKKRSTQEIELIYNIVKQVLIFDDRN